MSHRDRHHQQSAPPGWPQPPQQRQNWFTQNPGKTVALGIVSGLLIIGSIANAEDGDEPTPDSQMNFESSNQQADGGFEVDQSRGTREPRDRGEGSEAESELPPSGNEFVMPETAGMDLQLAQDTAIGQRQPAALLGVC
jgi:hypothetical protein